MSGWVLLVTDTTTLATAHSRLRYLVAHDDRAVIMGDGEPRVAGNVLPAHRGTTSHPITEEQGSTLLMWALHTWQWEPNMIAPVEHIMRWQAMVRATVKLPDEPADTTETT